MDVHGAPILKKVVVERKHNVFSMDMTKAIN